MGEQDQSAWSTVLSPAESDRLNKILGSRSKAPSKTACVENILFLNSLSLKGEVRAHKPLNHLINRELERFSKARQIAKTLEDRKAKTSAVEDIRRLILPSTDRTRFIPTAKLKSRIRSVLRKEHGDEQSDQTYALLRQPARRRAVIAGLPDSKKLSIYRAVCGSPDNFRREAMEKALESDSLLRGVVLGLIEEYAKGKLSYHRYAATILANTFSVPLPEMSRRRATLNALKQALALPLRWAGSRYHDH